MMYAAESFAARGLRFLHRDIKPGNTMIDRRLQVKITDFGLAKAFDQPRAETPIAPAAGLTSSGGAQLTVAGTVLGTPRYMSPEQCRAIVNLDARSDIYSFGCMFFEMLTGEPVFRAATMKEMLTKQCREAPPRPTDLTPHLPTDLDCVVLRCLEKDPARRYADFAELREDLAAAQLAIVGKCAPDAVTSKTPPPSALGEKLNRSMSLFELGERKEGARLFAEAIGARSGGAADTSAAPRRLVKGGVAGAPPAGEKQKEED
jgi:serine/threonine protein kinase